MSKPTVAFICVHNSCRSQMAEALGHLLAVDAFNSVSAGTEVVPRINQDAVRLMKDRYQVAISLFGLSSGATLATVVGVLVEVPVMLLLVNIANSLKGNFR